MLAGGLVCWPLLTPCATHPDYQSIKWARPYSDRIADPEVKQWSKRTPRLPSVSVDRALRPARLLSDAELGLQPTQLERQQYGGAETARDVATTLAGMYSLTLLDPEMLGMEKGREEKFLLLRERPRVEINADRITLRRQADTQRPVAFARGAGGARAVVTGPGGTWHLAARRIDYRAAEGELLLLGYPTVLAGLRSASLKGADSLMRLDLRQWKLSASEEPEIGDKRALESPPPPRSTPDAISVPVPPAPPPQPATPPDPV